MIMMIAKEKKQTVIVIYISYHSFCDYIFRFF